MFPELEFPYCEKYVLSTKSAGPELKNVNQIEAKNMTANIITVTKRYVAITNSPCETPYLEACTSSYWLVSSRLDEKNPMRDNIIRRTPKLRTTMDRLLYWNTDRFVWDNVFTESPIFCLSLQSIPASPTFIIPKIISTIDTRLKAIALYLNFSFF